MENKTNILFVAFEFPPLGGAGVQRSLKFVKYLPDFGVNPVVITVQETDYHSVMPGYPMDNSLCKEIPSGTIIKRIHCQMPSYETDGKLKKWARIFFSVVENFKKLWKDELKRELPEIIKKYNPKAIYISLPPFAMAPLWLDLLKEYHIPIITDFRDAWTQWCVSPNPSIIHYRIKLSYEEKILRKATVVICSSGQIMKDMQRVHPSINPQKFVIINNGYDGQLNFEEEIKILSGKKIVFGYVGSFYYTPESRDQIFTPWWKKPIHRMLQYIPRKEDWLYRSPYFFFKALQLMLERRPDLKDKIEIRFAGKTPDWLTAQINQFGLSDLCRHFGYLSHEEIISFQNQCDILLITSSKVLGGRDYSIAGKTYEYFTIGKPILAFVCEGEQKDILIESKMAIVCDPDDVVKSSTEIEHLFLNNTILSPDKKAIEKYNRKFLTSKLANLILKV